MYTTFTNGISAMVRSLRRIVGIDGEGLGRAPHRYVLMAWHDNAGKSDALENLDGLGTEACLAWLWRSLPRDGLICGFYLGYDWTMILRELSNAALYRLWRPHLRKRPRDEGSGFSWVRWRTWKLHYLAGCMQLKRHEEKGTLTIWDVGRFYQCAFAKALRDASIGLDVVERIEAMKLQRGDFQAANMAEIRAYCLDECRTLASLVEQLVSVHAAADIPLRSFYGPGSAASVVLKKWGIKKKRGKIPPPIRHVAARAFFGGRFEHAAIGRIEGPIFEADIVSAYPTACVELPCLEHADWEWTDSESDLAGIEQACVQYETARVATEQIWGPLPCRLADGTIVFPAWGSAGWAWLHEWQAARAGWRSVQFRSAWILRRDCDCQPFAGVRELFAMRNRVGRKTAIGLALKRTYNSIYGKLAQQIGDPPFRSQVWAGMITAWTRAKLLGVLARYDASVLAVATDGVYLTERPALDYGDDLGQWEGHEHTAITLVRPGIYWTESAVKSRGLPKKHIEETTAKILDAIERGEALVKLPPVTMFGGARQTIRQSGARILRDEKYGQWYERPAKISLGPEPKRPPGWGLWGLPNVESAPYRGTISKAALELQFHGEQAQYRR